MSFVIRKAWPPRLPASLFLLRSAASGCRHGRGACVSSTHDSASLLLIRRPMPGTVVDLFCGIGGLSHGFRRVGFGVAAGIDLDERCRYPFESNNDARFIAADIASVSAVEIRRLFENGEPRILAGCAPCQPFSTYRNGKKQRRNDERWRMLYEFERLVRGVRPEVVTMENVPQLTYRRVFRDFVASLEDLGYWTTWYVARASDYGVPQRRNRVVLFASRMGAVEMIAPTQTAPLTVRDAIGQLEPIPAGGRAKRDRVHCARNLSEINQRRIQATEAGGWWRDWDESLVLKCHKKKKGQSFRTVYGRMDWDRPAPTITTQCIGIGNGQFGHPEQDRAISVREAALLQSFPRSYRFVKPRERVRMQTLALHIGNAVPVKLGEAIARSIRNHLRLCGAV